MRKLLSIFLLALFGLSGVAPLFALSHVADAGVPACCRRTGKHHCTMSAAARTGLADQRPIFRSPTETCPFCPAPVLSLHSDEYFSPAVQATYTSVPSHPAAGTAQAESQWRMARERSRGKRGPPLA